MTNNVPAGSTDTSGEIDLFALFGTLWRGKWWIIFCALIGLFIGGYQAFVRAVPVYTANSTVAFESREEQVVDLESVVGGLGGDQASINTEVEVLRSRGLMEKVVLRLNLINDPEFNPLLRPEAIYTIGNGIKFVREQIQGPLPEAPRPNDRAILDKAIDLLLAKVSISNIRQSFVFRITTTTENPKKSALISNTLADLYILDQLEVKFEATETATEWLSDRVGELQVELEAAVEAVKDFNASSQLVSAEQLGGLNRQIKDLRDREAETKTAIETAQAQLTALDVARRSGDLNAMAAAADDRTLTRTLGLISNGSVADDSAFQTRFGQIIDRATLNVDRLQNQLTAFSSSITNLEAQTATQSDDLVQLQQLEREADASRLIYEFFLGRLKETSVQQGIQQADSRLLSAAVIPTSPSAPRKSMILALSLILGTMVGAALILLREFSQNTFRTAEDLENVTGYTVLGQIPSIPARRRSNVLKYLTDKPTSAAAEAVRNLRTSTLLSDIDHPPQVIMSTSSIPGEGKTTQSLSLAQNLSGLGKRVLLIEGDIRRRVFAEYFDIKGKRGILSVLSGKMTLEDAVVYNDQLGADILIGEKSQTNAADVFSSDAFGALMKDARSKYDYIIIDTPPVLIVPDARVIGQSVDAILYTVRWDKTTKRQVVQGLKSFSSVNLKVAGLVLGQISPKGMKRYGYGDDYGAYGSYGRGYYDN